MSAGSEPTYAELTRQDRNPLKRVIQGRRLRDALQVAGELAAKRIVDFGGGDGALCALAAERWPQARLVCFEPAPQLAGQARALLAGAARIEVVESEAGLASASADLIFCTEVFEHLPPAETTRALGEIERILAPGGRVVIGVPVELGPPALAKGLFRIGRRAGAFDARPATVISAGLGRPPRPRPLAEISPGRAYHPHHAGFDHRELLRQVAERFVVERQAGSPFPALPLWANSELHLRLRARA